MFCNKMGLAVLALAVTAGAHAATYTFSFNSIVSGPSPAGSDIATLTVSDSGLDQVLFTLSHNSTSGAGQFITEVYFNMDPFLVPTQTNQTPSNKFNGGIVASQNGVGSAGVDFDLQQSFQTSNSGGGANRLKPGESISFNLSGAGVDASDFVALSGGNRTDLYAMIHLQGLPNGQSVKLGAAVPEPATMAALGLGAVALIRRRRRN